MVRIACACVVLVVIVAVAGCSDGRTPTPTPDAARNDLTCASARPARQDPFPYDRDWKARDRYVGVFEEYDDIAYFDDVDASELGAMIGRRYIDPDEQYNAAPSVWAIFEFLCAHPTVRAHGYVVTIDREDYRATLETIYADRIDETLRRDARAFCKDTPEKTLHGHLECFWD